jgi:Secretion system C-terminal sorting domain
MTKQNYVCSMSNCANGCHDYPSNGVYVENITLCLSAQDSGTAIVQFNSNWHPFGTNFKKGSMKKYIHYLIVVTLLTCSLITGYAQIEAPESVQPQATADIPIITISPNPVHGNTFFYIQIDSCKNKSMNSLLVYNSDGYIVQNKVIQLQEGDNRFVISIAGLNSGFYIVRLVGRNIPNYSVSRQIMIDQ